MIDPFEEHPDTPSPEKKTNKTLTLAEVRSIIENEINIVNRLAPKTWGYNKQDIIEHLRSALYKAETNVNSKDD